jgi:hypothetical protein
MNLTILISAISAAVAGAAGFGLAWNLQAHQITKLNLEHANERISIQRAARATIERTSNAVIKAQNDAAGRVAVIKRNADSLRVSVDGLRDDLDVTARAAATSIDACTVAARTTSELLAVCADRYSELAGKAEGHVSDIRTLVDAWPK